MVLMSLIINMNPTMGYNPIVPLLYFFRCLNSQDFGRNTCNYGIVRYIFIDKR